MSKLDNKGHVESPYVMYIKTYPTVEEMIQIVVETKANTYGQVVYAGSVKHASYQGRCGLPTNFDSNYCYALGYGAATLLHVGKTGLISSVGFHPLHVGMQLYSILYMSLIPYLLKHAHFKTYVSNADVYDQNCSEWFHCVFKMGSGDVKLLTVGFVL
ncbi:pyrophosphate--fructose 6-phosphate 1-phosphotransferase subunit beta [Artemisia annua]|uniref:Pyrophosphate--fructose 6-phosphate 1-phosphotransferase subunit beta n=1 Tax=Artemisia annua TaxID=35608 RepID=A0A2U1KRD1_ARTAN|nr:pyrophosphate--fructose 6-phosphate 1-phosphotransferase subunit beta [Artemisia annua]